MMGSDLAASGCVSNHTRLVRKETEALRLIRGLDARRGLGTAQEVAATDLGPLEKKRSNW